MHSIISVTPETLIYLHIPKVWRKTDQLPLCVFHWFLKEDCAQGVPWDTYNLNPILILDQKHCGPSTQEIQLCISFLLCLWKKDGAIKEPSVWKRWQAGLENYDSWRPRARKQASWKTGIRTAPNKLHQVYKNLSCLSHDPQAANIHFSVNTIFESWYFGCSKEMQNWWWSES